MSLKLHVGCGTVYLEGYVNLDVPVAGYSFLASERPDLVEKNRTSVERYYKKQESRWSGAPGKSNSASSMGTRRWMPCRIRPTRSMRSGPCSAWNTSR